MNFYPMKYKKQTNKPKVNQENAKMLHRVKNPILNPCTYHSTSCKTIQKQQSIQLLGVKDEQKLKRI